jgi:general secretion pathway protein E
LPQGGGLHLEQINQLGQHLISSGKVTAADFQQALDLLGDGQIEVMLVKMGLVSEGDVTDALAQQFGLQRVISTDFPDVPIMEDRISPKFLRHHKALPIAVTDEEVIVAVSNPYDDYLASALRISCDREITLKLGLPSEIDSALERLYGSGRSQMDQIVEGLVPVTQTTQDEDVAHLKDIASEASNKS